MVAKYMISLTNKAWCTVSVCFPKGTQSSKRGQMVHFLAGLLEVKCSKWRLPASNRRWVSSPFRRKRFTPGSAQLFSSPGSRALEAARWNPAEVSGNLHAESCSRVYFSSKPHQKFGAHTHLAGMRSGVALVNHPCGFKAFPEHQEAMTVPQVDTEPVDGIYNQ